MTGGRQHQQLQNSLGRRRTQRLFVQTSGRRQEKEDHKRSKKTKEIIQKKKQEKRTQL